MANGDQSIKRQSTIHDLPVWAKSLIAVLLIAAAVHMSYQPYKKTVTDGVNVRTYYEVIAYLVQVVATTLLAFIIWMFKRELGIKNFGPITGSEPEVASKVEPQPGPAAQAADAVSRGRAGHILHAQVSADRVQLSNLFQRFRHMDQSQIARLLGTDDKTAEALLVDLSLEGKIEKSVIRDRATYILKEDYENLAIDELSRRISGGEEIQFVYKFVRLTNGMEIDALIETDKAHYLVEIKEHMDGARSFLESQLIRLMSFIAGNPTKDGKPYRVVLGVKAAPNTSPSEILLHRLRESGVPIWIVDLPATLIQKNR